MATNTAAETTEAPLSPDQPVGAAQFQTMAAKAWNVITAVRSLIEQSQPTERTFPRAEVAEILGISQATFSRRVADGTFPPGYTAPGSSRARHSLTEVRQMIEIEVAAGRMESPHRPGDAPPAIITVQNNKGGAGKTTVTSELFPYLAMRGLNVLVVDMDPQASLTAICGYQPDAEVNDRDTLLPYIEGDETTLDYAIKPVRHWPGVDIVPASTGLSEIDFLLPVNAQRDETGTYEFYAQLSNALKTVQDRYDVILIDSPPSMTYGAINCLYAGNALLVPLPAQPLDFDSCRKFMEMLGAYLPIVSQLRGDKEFDWFRVLITRYRANQETVASFVRNVYSPFVMEAVWPRTDVLEGSDTRTVYDFEDYPGDRRTLRRALEAADAVNSTIHSLIRRQWRTS